MEGGQRTIKTKFIYRNIKRLYLSDKKTLQMILCSVIALLSKKYAEKDKYSILNVGLYLIKELVELALFLRSCLFWVDVVNECVNGD